MAKEKHIWERPEGGDIETYRAAKAAKDEQQTAADVRKITAAAQAKASAGGKVVVTKVDKDVAEAKKNPKD